MKRLCDFDKKHYDVIVIGGGATGAGILRDLAMRGFSCALFESRDMAGGSSSHFHGLLHSGARYVVKDTEAAIECASENKILKRIAKHCIEDLGGLFIRTSSDDVSYEQKWVEACKRAKLPFSKVSTDKLKSNEISLSSNIASAYAVEDASVDGFRLVWQNLYSAKSYGAEFINYAKIIKILTEDNKIKGIIAEDAFTCESCEVYAPVVINAAGSWAGDITKLAGINLELEADKGALLVFNHRFAKHIINRLREPSDGDIFVPHGSVTIFGTTSALGEHAGDSSVKKGEVDYLKQLSFELFPDTYNYRVLRAFAGTRPLLKTNSAHGRAASRNFMVIDHEKDGLSGFVSIFAGKLTTYRLMAEKVTDIVVSKYFKSATKCKTADVPLLKDMSDNLRNRACKYFGENALDLAYGRLGEDFEEALKSIENDISKKRLLCECEFVTYAEYQTIAKKSTTRCIDDIRRRTRIGMGTCQGTFCAYRALSVLYEDRGATSDELKKFLSDRWYGITPVLSGVQLSEASLTRNIYLQLLNIGRTKS